MTLTEAISILDLKIVSADAIKEAYRKKAKLLHPDKGGDESKFKRLVAAYELLTGKNKPRRSVVLRPVVVRRYVWVQTVGYNTTTTGFQGTKLC